MFKISLEEERQKNSLRLILEGRLVGLWVGELRRVCEQNHVPNGHIGLTIDLCGLTSMDAEGQALLQDLLHQGATLECSGVMNQYLVEQMSLTKRKSTGTCRPCQPGEVNARH